MAVRTLSIPKGLPRGAAREWRSIYRSMPGHFDAANVILLTAYVLAAERHRQATEIVRQEGITQRKARGRMIVHPALREANRAARDLCRLYATLGFGLGYRAD